MSGHPNPADSVANRVALASWRSSGCPAWRHSRACDPPETDHQLALACVYIVSWLGLPSPAAFAASSVWSSSCPCSACSGTKRV